MPTNSRRRRVAAPKVIRGNHDDRRAIAIRCAVATGGNIDAVLAMLDFDASTARGKARPAVELDSKSYQALALARMPEQGRGGLQQYVKNRVDVANRIHPMPDGVPRFLAYHTFNSQRSDEGFPDEIVLDRARDVLHVWELKAEDGEVSDLQQRWLDGFKGFELGLDQLADAAESVNRDPPRLAARLIRPSDVIYIDRALGLS